MLTLNMRNRAYRIDFILCLLYFVTAISFLLLTDGILRYVLNVTLFLITLTILYVSPIKNKVIIWAFSTLIYFSYIAISFFAVDRQLNASSVVSFYSFFFISYVVLYSEKGRRYLEFLYIFFYFSVVLVFLLLSSGLNPEDVFPGSRNAISLLLVPLGAIFLLDKRIDLKGMPVLVLYLLIFVSCVIAQGRSGIITSALLLIAIGFIFLENLNYKRIFGTIVLVILFLVFLNTYFEAIYNLSYFDYFKSKGVDDDYRREMRNEYLSSLSATNIFFGTDMSRLPIISSFNSNPHNTYLYLHSSLGLLILLTMFFALSYWLKVFFTRDFVSFFALSALLLRLGTDSTSSIAILPLIFVSLLLLWRTVVLKRY